MEIIKARKFFLAPNLQGSRLCKTCLQCTVGVQMVLKLEEATFSYIASLLRFKGTLLRYYGAETYSVIKSLIINKDFCPGRL